MRDFLRSTTRVLPLILFFVFLSLPLIANAQATVDPNADFITQLGQAVAQFGGLSAVAKVSAVIMLLIASMKVNLINSLVWDKLPEGWKTLAAPILGALAGLVALYTNGTVDFPHLMVWVTAGAGAVILHEILDRVKLIPGIGPAYVAIIDLLEGFLDQKKTVTPTN